MLSLLNVYKPTLSDDKGQWVITRKLLRPLVAFIEECLVRPHYTILLLAWVFYHNTCSTDTVSIRSLRYEKQVSTNFRCRPTAGALSRKPMQAALVYIIWWMGDGLQVLSLDVFIDVSPSSTTSSALYCQRWEIGARHPAEWNQGTLDGLSADHALTTAAFAPSLQRAAAADAMPGGGMRSILLSLCMA